MDLDAQQAMILGTVAGTNLVIFAGNFMLAIYNTVKHLVPLKINQTLIVLFYSLTFLVSIALLTETTQRTFFPRQDIFDYDRDTIAWGGIARIAKEILIAALDFTMVATMY